MGQLSHRQSGLCRKRQARKKSPTRDNRKMPQKDGIQRSFHQLNACVDYPSRQRLSFVQPKLRSMQNYLPWAQKSVAHDEITAAAVSATHRKHQQSVNMHRIISHFSFIYFHSSKMRSEGEKLEEENGRLR